ncbi:esterase-like activity of phytase family protein [Aliiroseovarius sediminis]|uniref:esterase-like activity of phytase family protein n=1 Tax=Aliiroseovarius sediminis TaxID=2925839 RepID=UPI001F561A05|nr:esterase-like activity of phytase family protein [Aliiroseovarius sediminis]MCI2395768.1 esterase-like activity of phytase family protein [Aliiroseovarius sediminis]
MPYRLVLALGALAALVAFFTLDLGAQTVPEAKLVSSYRWHGGDDPAFGGFSGIEVTEDGTTFVALTDRGHVTRGKFIRENGVIKKIVHSKLNKLTSPRGKPLRGIWTDSEGLAIADNGDVYVSFEVQHRITKYVRGNAKGQNMPKNPATDRMAGNSAQEALAINRDGTLFMIPEGSNKQTAPHVVYRLAPGARTWDTRFTIARHAPYLPVGADIGPDGRLYLLERHLGSILGFTNRVRRFDITPDGLTNETILLQSKVGTHDNLEGLAVWRDTDGLIRLTMISDDNFMFFQVTEIVEYVVPEGAGLTADHLINAR